MIVRKYRKKPVVIEAIQFDGTPKAFEAVGIFCGQSAIYVEVEHIQTVAIKTLEGTSYNVTKGDWIIKGVKGEFYPCKPDIFQATYDYVEPSPKDKCEHEWHPITQGTWNCTKCGEPYYKPESRIYKSGCEYIGCKYADRDEEGYPICTDENEYVNAQGEPVCGLRDDALIVEDCIVAPQPEPMPLIEGWAIDKRLDDFFAVADSLDDEGKTTRAKAMRYLIERCKRAESPEKVQQVRKDLIEEIDKLMELEKCDATVMAYFNAYYWIDKDEWEEFKQAHLRAMAEEK